MKLRQTTLDFERKGKKYSFTVFHNLEYFRLDIEAAFYNWVYRTKEFTEKSFCEYVMSKNSNIICLTEEEMVEYSKDK